MFEACALKSKFKIKNTKLTAINCHKDIKAFGILGVSVGLKWKKMQDNNFYREQLSQLLKFFQYQ